MGRNGHRAGAKHRGGRRGGGRGQPQRKPRAPDGGNDDPGAAPDPPSPADGVREVHEHDEPGRNRLAAGPEPDHPDGGEGAQLPPAEPRHRRDGGDGPEPPGLRRGNASAHSRYAFAARRQDGPEAKEGQRRPREPAGRNSFWSPSADELRSIERRKLEPKPEGNGHNDAAAGDRLGHGVVGDPPRRGHRSTQSEPPHRPLRYHDGAKAENGATGGHGGTGGGGGCAGANSHTGSAAAAAAAAGPWPRGQQLRTAWPGSALLEWPQWVPPQGPLVPWNRARWNPQPQPQPARPWPGSPPGGARQPGPPWHAPNCQWGRGGGGRRTAAPWAGRGRRQFGPPGWRQPQPQPVGWQDAPERRAAWDDAWKAFIRCSADPIEVARTLRVGTEAEWGNLYAQFVCTAPRTAVAPPFDPHASRIGKATAARITAQF